MLRSYNICVLIDKTVLSIHHGVRRYLMTLCAALEAQGHSVHLLDGTRSDRFEALALERGLLVDNGFCGNRLVGSSRRELLAKVRSGSNELLSHSSGIGSVPQQFADTWPSRFDLCILGAPWIKNQHLRLPDSDRFVCIAYDAIPNLYYFSNPQDRGLHMFAHAHYQGYHWADQEADGIFCISEITARQCEMFGFGQRNGLSVLPPMIPPGYRTLNFDQVKTPRGRVGLLAAPFDRRKGLLSIPRLVNAGHFDSLLIYGRPRCSHDDLVAFFEQLEIEDVEWWCDVDFYKQVELYTRAKVLIFPSLNEGLGFPVLEAYACGTSVLTSNIDPLNTLVLPEDLLADTEEERARQINRRVDERVDPMKYRRFVDELCSSNKLGLIPESVQ